METCLFPYLVAIPWGAQPFKGCSTGEEREDETQQILIALMEVVHIISEYSLLARTIHMAPIQLQERMGSSKDLIDSS